MSLVFIASLDSETESCLIRRLVTIGLPTAESVQPSFEQFSGQRPIQLIKNLLICKLGDFIQWKASGPLLSSALAFMSRYHYHICMSNLSLNRLVSVTSALSFSRS